MAREDKPWSMVTIHTLQHLHKVGILLGCCPKVMLSAHHDDVDIAINKVIPMSHSWKTTHK